MKDYLNMLKIHQSQCEQRIVFTKSSLLHFRKTKEVVSFPLLKMEITFISQRIHETISHVSFLCAHYFV